MCLNSSSNWVSVLDSPSRHLDASGKFAQFPLLQHLRILWPVPSLGSSPPHTWDLVLTRALWHHHGWFPAVLGQICHFLSASVALSLEYRNASFLRKSAQGGEFSENLLVGKMGLCFSNSWFPRLAGHQIQGWKPFSFQLLKTSLPCLLASRVAAFWFLVWPVLFSLKGDRILFLSPVLWDFQVTYPGAGLFSSVLLSSCEILPSGIMSFSSRTFSGIPSWFLLLGFL